MKWEYNVDPKQGLGVGGIDEEEYLNRKGQEGWQLTGVCLVPAVKCNYYYWKRSIQEVE